MSTAEPDSHLLVLVFSLVFLWHAWTKDKAFDSRKSEIRLTACLFDTALLPRNESFCEIAQAEARGSSLTGDPSSNPHGSMPWSINTMIIPTS